MLTPGEEFMVAVHAPLVQMSETIRLLGLDVLVAVPQNAPLVAPATPVKKIGRLVTRNTGCASVMVTGEPAIFADVKLLLGTNGSVTAPPAPMDCIAK
jgi:hypothetical protein